MDIALILSAGLTALFGMGLWIGYRLGYADGRASREDAEKCLAAARALGEKAPTVHPPDCRCAACVEYSETLRETLKNEPGETAPPAKEG